MQFLQRWLSLFTSLSLKVIISRDRRESMLSRLGFKRTFSIAAADVLSMGQRTGRKKANEHNSYL